MYYLDFLARVHELFEPPTYLEIGIRNGDSLALARSRAIGIDPAFRLENDLPATTTLYRETSDEFFDRPAPLIAFGGEPIAFSFIDGMHLSEFALRDFMNVERFARWSSVIVFDDILPTSVDMAARDRHTSAWTGDVYKILDVLATHRPDLTCLRVATEPTGLLLVTGLDPQNRTLAERYDEIVHDAICPDPQEVPRDVLRRRGTVPPEAVLDASFWSVLKDARVAGTPREEGLRDLRRAVRRDFGPLRPLRRLLPVPA